MWNDDTETTTNEETGDEAKKTKRTRKAKKAAAKGGKKAKAAAKGKKKRAANGNGQQKFNEDRKDVYAALLRVRTDSPRGKIIERLAKSSGKTFTTEQIAEWVEWDKRMAQSFCSQRIKYKLGKYPDAAKRIKLIAEGDGKYGLEVR